MKKDVYVTLSFEFHDLRNFLVLKVITFLSDLKKRIQTALKFFFFISYLLFKKKCIKFFEKLCHLARFFSNNAENEFAFIE